jgi:hypothetical protein
MKEERAEERYHTAGLSGDMKKDEKKSFEVFDVSTGQLIGYLMNLSSTGMMVQTKDAINDGATYELRVDLPKEVNGSNQLLVSVRSIWSKRDGSPNSYNNGFEILGACPYVSDVIAVLFQGSISPMPEAQNIARKS